MSNRSNLQLLAIEISLSSTVVNYEFELHKLYNSKENYNIN